MLLQVLDSENQLNNLCIICCGEDDEEDDVISSVVTLSCDCVNKYHLECLQKWLKVNSVCPICKNQVEQEPLYAIEYPPEEFTRHRYRTCSRQVKCVCFSYFLLILWMISLHFLYI